MTHTPIAPGLRLQTSGYGYPFEVYHSRAFGKDMPPYWVRIKAGMMPGYFSVLAMFPEVKTGTTVILDLVSALSDHW